MNPDDLFEDVVEFPDPSAQRRLAGLVGLDQFKVRLVKEARLLLNPSLLDAWSLKHHKVALPAIRQFRERPPLFIFAGDVGTGKTVLAETFADSVARAEKISISLFRMSLNVRGAGAVGEMTRLLSTAFDRVRDHAARGNSSGKRASATVLVIDEADAIAQSRELAQMHHEDRAGVNALIRGISSLGAENLPAIVVMCTNRLESLDPAVRRRAAAIFEFERPNDEQRAEVFRVALEGAGLSVDNIRALALATGPADDRSYGYTFSDLTDRLLPSIIVDAFPDNAISFERALALARQTMPTEPFAEQAGG